MSKTKLLLFFISLCLHTSVYAQAAPFNWELYLTEQYENSEEAAVSMEDAYQHLLTLTQQPLDINTAETEDFLLIPGLDINQISDIIEYRTRYGNMRSIDELMLIPSIDDRQRRFLSCFFHVKAPDSGVWYSPGRLLEDLRHARHSLLLTASIPTYFRAGDKGATADGAISLNKYANAYLGDPVKHSLRYCLSLNDHVTFNLTGGKNAAEPFFGSGNHYGYDRYACNLRIRRLGPMRTIIIGQYRAQFGMGLTLNNNMSLGKQSILANSGRIANVFVPHSSTSDSRHLQGIAATIDIRDLTISAFWSYRHIDATLNDNGTISTILTSPYHRTPADMRKRDNSAVMTTGTHAQYSRHFGNGVKADIGASFLYTWLNRPMNPVFSTSDTIPRSKLYRFFFPKGNSFVNSSIDYRIRYADLSFAGEIATGWGTGSIATLNTLTWRTTPRLTLTAIQRYYSYQYHSLYSGSFSDGGSIQNESGLLLSAQYRPSRSLVIEGYSDIAYHPWLKYRISASSYSLDNSLSSTLTHKLWTFSLRYRIHSRQRDKTDDAGYRHLLWKTDQHLRLISSWDNDVWNLRSQIEGCLLSFDSNSSGIIISQAAAYSGPLIRFIRQLAASVAYFNTSDYDSRLYTYERGMQYSFGYSAFYGHGIRWSLMAKGRLSKHISGAVKVGHSHYFDRNSIGSAEREIFSYHQTDIDLQVKYTW